MNTQSNRNHYVLFHLVLVFLIMIGGCQKNEKKIVQNIQWIENIDQGLAMAAEQNKPIMIDFMATWCPPCKKMEDSTFSNPDVIKKAHFFIPIRIDVDKQEGVANKYESNASKYGGIGIPNILFLDTDGKEIKHPVGYKNPTLFLAIMDSVLAVTN